MGRSRSSSPSGSRGHSRSRSRSRSKKSSGEGTGKTIIIRGIDDDIKKEDIKDAFTKYGTINQVFLPKNYKTGKSKGYAFVEFESSSAATSSLDFNGDIVGRSIVISLAKNKRKTPDEMRKRDRYYKHSRSRSPYYRHSRHSHKSHSHHRHHHRHHSRSDSGSRSRS